MFRFFETRVDPYPADAPAAPPRGFFAFLWAGTKGTRPYILAMTLLTAAIGAFEALLFAMLGRVVDWLARVEPARLWTDEGGTLLLLAAIILGSTALVALQTLLKHQTLAGNFPMRLRWNFHRLMLGQSMSFYQ
ncbi:MAG TPA: multidrug ABC transporter ATP-binding protein, partial [Rhodocyclaceae bacterium]|nr:multidrug ABC transporter ATP-binding protein [Rhodocyclaceae bacterium]